jgi:uncharacterized 2Fe-2S/4Fe-4S cluster protein (DUF4445 family)
MSDKKTNSKKYGIAIDIGSTTLAGALVDIEGSRRLASASEPNPQRAYGSDVLARIEKINSNPSLLTEMQDSVRESCNKIIAEILTEGGVKREDIAEVSAAGNSVMEHIFMGVSPEPMGRVPYKPAFKESKFITTSDVGLNLPNNTPFYLFPMIGGFVGGDAVSVALAGGMLESKDNTLIIDIGTNSEILLSTADGLFAAAAAAGPAFEGGQIESGMTAERGAITGINISEDIVTLDVIDNVAPRGICGSGIIDVITELLKAGIIQESGRIKARDEITTNLSTRITEFEDGNSFTLFKGPKAEITITQADVRALQVAKSAIRSGITIVMKKAGIEAPDVEKILVAGAFGSNITEEGLCGIGLFDNNWKGRTQSIGNAVLDGTTLTLCSEQQRARADEIGTRAKYVSLSGSKHFEKEFISNIDFPKTDT